MYGEGIDAVFGQIYSTGHEPLCAMDLYTFRCICIRLKFTSNYNSTYNSTNYNNIYNTSMEIHD